MYPMIISSKLMSVSISFPDNILRTMQFVGYIGTGQHMMRHLLDTIDYSAVYLDGAHCMVTASWRAHPKRYCGWLATVKTRLFIKGLCMQHHNLGNPSIVTSGRQSQTTSWSQVTGNQQILRVVLDLRTHPAGRKYHWWMRIWIPFEIKLFCVLIRWCDR